MKINLTEALWDILNPEADPMGTAWMFTNERYFMMTMWKDIKEFLYHDERLENPLCMMIDAWDKTAGTIVIEKNYIELQLKDTNMVLYHESNVIPFKRK